MASPAQIAASLANAAHSTGPVTPSGKETVSRNALTHGLTATRLIIPGENPADLEALSAAIVHRYNPQNFDECRHADLIVASEWRLARAWRIHDSFLCEVQQQQQTTGAGEATIFSNPSQQRGFSLMLRYIRSIERSHRDAVKNLVAIQKQREADQEPRPEAAPAVAPKPALAAAPAPAAPPTLTRAERRAIERAQRKAAIRAARGSSVDPSALFRNQQAA